MKIELERDDDSGIETMLCDAYKFGKISCYKVLETEILGLKINTDLFHVIELRVFKDNDDNYMIFHKEDWERCLQ